MDPTFDTKGQKKPDPMCRKGGKKGQATVKGNVLFL